jgi:hypothetical protein
VNSTPTKPPTVSEVLMAMRDAEVAKAHAAVQKKVPFRQKMRTNRRFGYGVAMTVLMVGGAVLAYQWVSQFRSERLPDIRVFYTIDDGKTYFADSEGKLPPFDLPNGVAVRAHVFNGGSGPFVGYLERFSPEARTVITRVGEAARTAKPGDKPPPELAKVADAQRNGRQVKRPKDTAWVSINSAAGQTITRVTTPGSKVPATEIRPD